MRRFVGKSKLVSDTAALTVKLKAELHLEQNAGLPTMTRKEVDMTAYYRRSSHPNSSDCSFDTNCDSALPDMKS